MHAQIDREN